MWLSLSFFLQLLPGLAILVGSSCPVAQSQPVCTQLLLFEGVQHLFSKLSWHLGWSFLRCPEPGRSWLLHVLEFHNNKVTLFSEHIGVHSEVDTLQEALRKNDWEPQDRLQTGGGDASARSLPTSWLACFSLPTAVYRRASTAHTAQQGAFSLYPFPQHKNFFFFFFGLTSPCLASPVRLTCGGPKDRK